MRAYGPRDTTAVLRRTHGRLVNITNTGVRIDIVEVVPEGLFLESPHAQRGAPKARPGYSRRDFMASRADSTQSRSVQLGTEYSSAFCEAEG